MAIKMKFYRVTHMNLSQLVGKWRVMWVCVCVCACLRLLLQHKHNAFVHRYLKWKVEKTHAIPFHFIIISFTEIFRCQRVVWMRPHTPKCSERTNRKRPHRNVHCAHTQHLFEWDIHDGQYSRVFAHQMPIHTSNRKRTKVIYCFLHTMHAFAYAQAHNTHARP